MDHPILSVHYKMMKTTHPLAASKANSNVAPKESLSKEAFYERIQRLKTLENDISSRFKELQQLRAEKTQINEDICNFIESNNLQNKRIETAYGNFMISHKNEYSNLSFSYIQECLQKKIADRKIVEELIAFIKDNRKTNAKRDVKFL